MPNDLRRALPLTVLLAAACASEGGESSTAATTGSGSGANGSMARPVVSGLAVAGVTPSECTLRQAA